MHGWIQIETADRVLLGSIAASLAEAARRSGPWLVCRLGCTQCCLGPFAITQLDALRLRWGLRQLRIADPARAAALERRAAAYTEAITPLYPGDPTTGALFEEDQLPDSFDSVPCPALDPTTGACELYDWRPITCRTFGPVTAVEGDTFAACELCYSGATSEQMAACAVELDPEGLEATLLAELAERGSGGATLVAFALRDPDSGS
jgi:Fe-S-cluster containining protein